MGMVLWHLFHTLGGIHWPTCPKQYETEPEGRLKEFLIEIFYFNLKIHLCSFLVPFEVFDIPINTPPPVLKKNDEYILVCKLNLIY